MVAIVHLLKSSVGMERKEPRVRVLCEHNRRLPAYLPPLTRFYAESTRHILSGLQEGRNTAAEEGGRQCKCQLLYPFVSTLHMITIFDDLWAS